MNRQIHLVLRHDHVLGRQGQTIDANITQIDLHDFCRLTTTYDLAGFHVVTRVESQHRICEEMLDFWRQGFGKMFNPDRVTALQRLQIHKSFEELLAAYTTPKPPLLLGTSAKPHQKNLDFTRLSSIIRRSDQPAFVLFGTSWGLNPQQLDRCDWVIPPIEGQRGYNHLSVRCAAAIIVDRLFLYGASHKGADS